MKAKNDQFLNPPNQVFENALDTFRKEFRTHGQLIFGRSVRVCSGSDDPIVLLVVSDPEEKRHHFPIVLTIPCAYALAKELNSAVEEYLDSTSSESGTE